MTERKASTKATAKANTGVLRCAQDDSEKQNRKQFVLEDSHRVVLLERQHEPQDWRGEQEGVDAVQDASVAGQ
jgi:hypothetical protein